MSSSTHILMNSLSTAGFMQMGSLTISAQNCLEDFCNDVEYVMLPSLTLYETQSKQILLKKVFRVMLCEITLICGRWNFLVEDLPIMVSKRLIDFIYFLQCLTLKHGDFRDVVSTTP
jgi:hypothetical protein